MKSKVLVALLLAVVMSVSVALFLPGTAMATTCSGSGQTGYVHAGIFGNGGSYSEGLQIQTALYNSGNFRNYIGVTNGSSTLQAGIIRDNTGSLQRYAEVGGNFIFRTSAVKGTYYTPKITKITQGLWKLEYAGMTFNNIVLENVTSAVNYTSSNQSGGTCNSFSFADSVGNPYDPSNMTFAGQACPFAEQTLLQYPTWYSANC
jgi:hypothetical protein